MIEWLVLIALNVLLLAPSLRCGAVVDDNAMINKLREMKKKFWENKKTWKSIKSFIEVCTYGAGSTKNSREDHSISIILNIVNTLLIYKLTNSFLCAFIWLCNPVNNQISLWLNGRRYAISIMFSLLALNYNLFFLPFAGLAGMRHILSAPLFLFSGNIMVSIFCALLIIAVASKKYISAFKCRKKAFAPNNELQKINLKKSIIYIKTFGYYMIQMLFPTPKMYHKNLYYFGKYKEGVKKGYSLDKDFFMGLVIFSFFSYEMAIGNYWAFWVVLFISQWCGICTVTMNAADRYCSLPLVGFTMILIKYVSMLPNELQSAIYIMLTTIYLVKYIRLYRAYISLFHFYDYHLEINPADVETRCYYAAKLVKDEPFKAMTLSNDGLKMMPYDFKLLLNMVLVQLRVGRYDQVQHFMERAEKVIPLGEEEDTEREFKRIRKDLLMSATNRKQRREMKL